MKDCKIYGLLAIALGGSSSACAMTAPAADAFRCEVVNGDKLPAASGGAAALCAAIERAATSSAGQPFTVEVKVGPRSMLGADVTLADGRKLSSLRMAEMDRPISAATFDRFGAAIAAHVAGVKR